MVTLGFKDDRGIAAGDSTRRLNRPPPFGGVGICCETDGCPYVEEMAVSNQPADRGDALVRAGAIVFAAGAVVTLVTFVPLFLDLTRLPSAAYWACMLMPLGFLLSLAGLLASARAQRRRARAEV